ncbi:MAG: arylsulfatase [Planctomycetaceae bacterium]|jgi:arylsulfatase A
MNSQALSIQTRQHFDRTDVDRGHTSVHIDCQQSQRQPLVEFHPSTTVATAVVLCAILTINAAAADHPNIVVVMVDDMGYGDPGCFNRQSKIPTPHIDSLARDGMMFTDAHAPGPLCHMSRYGLLTGQYPFRIDVKLWRQQPLIEPQQMTIASLASSRGYHTAMVGKWHVGFHENGYDHPLPGGPVDRGFDTYFGIRASTDIPPYFYIRNDHAVEPPSDHIDANNSEGWSPIQGAFWRSGGIAPNLKLHDVLPRFTDEAIQVIQGHSAADADRDKPLMLYLAYPAPHTPWLPSEEFAGKSGAGMYGDFMMMVDAHIGRVLAALNDANMAKETLVIFTSDNGPCWFESDDERFGHDSSGGLRGMKADAWEGGHRMPFIVRWPGVVQAGSTSDQIVCFTDLLATFADLLGVDLPDDAGPDSFSFLSELQGGEANDTPARESFVMQAGSVPSMMTIRSGDWKLITGVGSGGFSGRNRRMTRGPDDPSGQLYNMANDLAETNNLYPQHPEIVVRLTALMEHIIRSGGSRNLQ